MMSTMQRMVTNANMNIGTLVTSLVMAADFIDLQKPTSLVNCAVAGSLALTIASERMNCKQSTIFLHFSKMIYHCL